MLNRAKKYFDQVIRGKKTGPFTAILKGVLRLLSFPYRLAVFCRNWAYDNEWLRPYQPPVPVVVSIGNIVVGGSGKTPVTLWLAHTFSEEARIGILSRGYNSPAEKLPKPVTLCAGKGPIHSAAYTGDEPFMLASNLPGAYIFVGRDRLQSANMAAKAVVEILFLDDGMQHRQLGRDYEVVVLDADDPLGQNNYLPRGLLREGPESLSRADIVIVNHANDDTAIERTTQLVKKYCEAPVVCVQFDATKLYDMAGNEVETLEDKSVALFCAIAQPERFYETVQKLGPRIVGQEAFVDHHFFTEAEITRLAVKQKAQGAEWLVCTEKDKVKLPDLPDLALPIVWVKMEMRVVAGQPYLDEFIGKIRDNLNIRMQKR